jgi:tRNA(Arg) A34 adenosine deaminase TadA
MCLGAIYWARPEKVYFACTREDAAEAKFDDQFIYDEIDNQIDERKIEFENILRNEAIMVFKKWNRKADKKTY